jgi:thioesterase III
MAIEIPVRGYHIDMFGHVNNARYLEFLESARWAAYTNVVNELLEKGLAITIVNININFRKEAKFGQTLVVDVDLTETGSRSVKFAQKIIDKASGNLIADAIVTCAVVSLKKGKATLIDEEIKRIFTEGEGIGTSR